MTTFILQHSLDSKSLKFFIDSTREMETNYVSFSNRLLLQIYSTYN